MPYYEFECVECKETFTVKQTFAEHDKHRQVKCPKCGAKKVTAVVSQVLAKTSRKA